MFRGIGRAIFFWWGIRNKYDKINEDAEWREKSVRMGVESILRSIFGAIFTLLFVYLAYWLFSGGLFKGISGAEALAAMFIFPLFIIVIALVCGLGAFIFYFQFVVASIIYARYQLKLNKKAVGYVALVLSILFTVGTVVVGVLLLGSIGA